MEVGHCHRRFCSLANWPLMDFKETLKSLLEGAKCHYNNLGKTWQILTQMHKGHKGRIDTECPTTPNTAAAISQLGGTLMMATQNTSPLTLWHHSFCPLQQPDLEIQIVLASNFRNDSINAKQFYSKPPHLFQLQNFQWAQLYPGFSAESCSRFSVFWSPTTHLLIHLPI